MGDSDDDGSGGRRDKFRRERNDYDSRDKRDDITDNDRRDVNQRKRESYGTGNAGRGSRDYYHSPDRNSRSHDSPPQKRFRQQTGRDWDSDHRSGRGGFQTGSTFQGSHGGSDRFDKGGKDIDSSDTRVKHATHQPPMITFKQFVAKQSNDITHKEAEKKFYECMAEFKREQIAKFFTDHKDEEWFRSKYHPDECDKRLQDAKEIVRRRCDVFMYLFENNWLKDVTMDTSKEKDIVRFLDAVVFLLEGGDKEDLSCIDEEIKEEKKVVPVEPPKEDTKVEAEQTESTGEVESADNFDEDKEDLADEDEAQKTEEPAPPGTGLEEESLEPVPEPEVSSKARGERFLHKTKSIFSKSLDLSITKADMESLCKKFPGFMRVALQDPAPERQWTRRGWITFNSTADMASISLHLSNLKVKNCDVTFAVNRELENRVRPQTGILSHKPIVQNDLRHCAHTIAELDHRWGLWEDPKKSEDTPKEVLNGESEEKEEEEQPKTEESNGISKDDDVVVEKKHDLTLLLSSRNPLLQNITEFLVEDGNFEEEALLGISASMDETQEKKLDRNEDYLKVLDRMLLYLRVVHSIDYYSGMEYSNEDEMPHRCGLIHARGAFIKEFVTQQAVTDHISRFEEKISNLLSIQARITNDVAKKLGLKNEEEEVEKFIQANTQQVGSDRWLCPISGKKFKGPEFVRKHILNKNSEKVDEVKREVEYFNNYIRDPRRPSLPEAVPQTRSNREDHGHRMSGGSGNNYGNNTSGYGGSSMYSRGHPQVPHVYRNYGGSHYNRGGPHGNFQPHMGFPRGGHQFSGHRSGRKDPRNIVEYVDLDAPSQGDVF